MRYGSGALHGLGFTGSVTSLDRETFSTLILRPLDQCIFRQS